MAVMQSIVFGMIAVMGTGIVFTRKPVNQAILMSFFGLLLALLFLLLQAPDVALSEIVVGAIVYPMMVLLTLAKVKDYALRHEAEQEANDNDSQNNPSNNEK